MTIMERIGFGGGCHWCTEGIFQALKGVREVDQGFIQSNAPSDSWAEGVIVDFDPLAITLETLVEVHLRTHSAEGTYSPGGRYRSAVYIVNADQRPHVARMIDQFAAETGSSSRTAILPLSRFRQSEPRFRNYYRTGPDRPFCRRYIDPKLDYIRRHFADVALPPPDMGTATA